MLLSKIYSDIVARHGNQASDKGTRHSYIDVYEHVLAPYRTRPVSVLEVGVEHGSSLQLWENYFINAELIIGLDKDASRVTIPLSFARVRQVDSTAQDEVDAALAGGTFDVIIDDGDHTLASQTATFYNLFKHLSSDGLYVIEDLQDIDRFNLSAFNQVIQPYRGKVVDLRAAKGRYDDVLLIVAKT